MLTGKKQKEREAYNRRHAKEGGGEFWKEERATQEVRRLFHSAFAMCLVILWHSFLSAERLFHIIYNIFRMILSLQVDVEGAGRDYWGFGVQRSARRRISDHN